MRTLTSPHPHHPTNNEPSTHLRRTHPSAAVRTLKTRALMCYGRTFHALAGHPLPLLGTRRVYTPSHNAAERLSHSIAQSSHSFLLRLHFIRSLVNIARPPWRHHVPTPPSAF